MAEADASGLPAMACQVAVDISVAAQQRSVTLAARLPRPADAPEGAVWALETYSFLDSDQFAGLDALLLRLRPENCYWAGGERRSAKSDAFKVDKLLEKRAVVSAVVPRGRFRRDGLDEDLQRLSGEPHAGRGLAAPARGCLACLMNALEIMEEVDRCGAGAGGDEAAALGADLANPHGGAVPTGGEGSYLIRTGTLAGVMRLDSAAAEAVNLLPDPEHPNAKGSLLGLLDHTRTRMGRRLLERWLRQPLMDLEAIEERQRLTEVFVNDTVVADALRDGPLRGCPDLEVLASRIRERKGGARGLGDLHRLYVFCEASLPLLVDTLKEAEEPGRSLLNAAFLAPLEKLAKDFGMFRRLVEHVVDLAALPELRVNPRFNATLADLSTSMEEVRSDVEAALEDIRGDLGIASIKCDASKDHGFLFRLPGAKDQAALRSAKGKVEVVQHLKNGTYFRTPALRNAGRTWLELRDEYDAAQASLVESALETAATYLPLVESALVIVARLDVLVSFAATATAAPLPYVKPEFCRPDDEGHSGYEVREARHPCVEFMDGVSFIPNDFVLDRGASRFHIVTGPNMGGKSTYIRTLGCLSVLGQIGSFVPAAVARLPVVDAVLARVGASDAQQRGISTFMAEMLDASGILGAATRDSLVIIDELGRGTSTMDGFGLAWAISDHVLRKNKSFCLFATHFHEVTALGAEAGVVNRHVAASVADDQDLTFLYEVRDGPCLESYGVHCAALAGMPSKVVARAREKAAELERLPKRARLAQ